MPAHDESIGQLDEILAALLSEGSRSNESWRSIRYQRQWWQEWCERHGYSSQLPVSAKIFGYYIVSLVDPDGFDPERSRREDGPYSVSQINHAVSAMRAAHIDAGMPSPTDDPLVRNTVKGAKRISRSTRGPSVQRAAFDPAVLRLVLDQRAPFSGRRAQLRWLRTRAWILTAFHLNLRWQDWAGLRWTSTLRRVDAGWLVILADGKTRLEQDRKVLTPADDPRLCPVAALDEWAAAKAWVPDSVVFRSLKCSDGDETVLDSKHATKDIKAAFAAAGLPTNLLGTHSARRSFAISAVVLDKLDPVALAAAGGWATVRTAQHYAEQVATRDRASARQRGLEAK